MPTNMWKKHLKTNKMNNEQYNELKAHIKRQDQQLMDLHHRLRRQEKLMRMAAVVMIVLMLVWLIMVAWPV